MKTNFEGMLVRKDMETVAMRVVTMSMPMILPQLSSKILSLVKSTIGEARFIANQLSGIVKFRLSLMR